MGGAATGGRPFPAPGQIGSNLGMNYVQRAQDPAQLPNLRPMQPLPTQTASQILPALAGVRALTPITANQGVALQPGQAAFPTGQTASNPWGINRGGSGAMPLRKRPGTLPGTRDV
jgi:hypothetical protein